MMLSGHFIGTRIYAKVVMSVPLSERYTITKLNQFNSPQALSHQTPLDKLLKFECPSSQSLR